MEVNNINRSLEVLGLDANAGPDEIKEAYKDLVKVWHPDRFVHDPKLQKKANDKLSEINEAYHCLKDYKKIETTTDEESLHPKAYAQKDGSATEHKEKKTAESGESGKTTVKAAKRADIYVLERQWARLLARVFDMYSLSMPCGFIAGAIIKNTFLESYIGQFFFTVLTITIMESVILAATGTTAGKYLLGIGLLNAKGKNLTFSEALSREFRVYVYGFTFGVPFICFYFMAKEYKLLKSTGTASWDNLLKLRVTYKEIEKKQIYKFVFLFILIMAAYTYGFDMLTK
ncbi:MAG: DnaJ domain-containing protein [Nitrospirae bacterium YQR-1]